MTNTIKPVATHEKMVRYALWYHKAGFNIVPFLAPQERTGAKATHLKWKPLQTTRQTQEDIQELLRNPDNSFNFSYGMLAINGINGLRSFDMDKADTTDALYILLDRLGLPRDYAWVTQSGSHRGYHVWFHNAEGDAALLATGLPEREKEPGVPLAKYDRPPINPAHFARLELRWHASLTALPGSLHPSGNRYRFVNAMPTEPPTTVSIERIKAAWDALVQPYKQEIAGEQTTTRDTGETIQIDRENETSYGRAALKNIIEKLEATRDGRYNAIYGHAWTLFELVNGGQLNHDHVAEAVYAACEVNGALEHHGEAKIRDQIDRAITSAGTTQRVPPAQRKLTQHSELDVEFVLDCMYKGEYGDSILFAKIFRGRVIYDHTSQEWYFWNKHHWKVDDTRQIRHLVSGELASVYLRAGAELNIQVSKQEAAAAAMGEDEDQEQAKARIAKLKKTIHTLTERAMALRSVSRNSNVLTFACTHEGMKITLQQWDNDRWLLPVPNGVIDLHTGLLRDGKPQDYIRTVCPTEWKGLHAPAPRWELFWHQIFELRVGQQDGQRVFIERNQDELQRRIAFMHRFFGYAITGEVFEHVFMMLYGEDGRNGKDTIETAISHALGEMSEAVSKDVLIESGGKGKAAGSASPHLMDLIGKRIAWANEPEKGSRFAIGQIKELSGGGKISARGLYEKKETKIDPVHQLVLLTNHKPVADPNDKAFWERLRLITFDMRFVENPKEVNERKKDIHLVNELKKEAPGILAWLVRGCLDWQREGLQTPQEIIDDGLQYRDEQDVIHIFIQECCIRGEKEKTQAKELYKKYKVWCEEGYRKPVTDTSFGLLLGKKNIAKKRSSVGMVYLGISLREIMYSSVGSDATLHPTPEAASQATLEDFFENENVGSDVDYTCPSEAASQACLASTDTGKECIDVGFPHKVPESAPHEGQFSKVYAETIHTIHLSQTGNTVKQPVESVQADVELGTNYTLNPTQTLHNPTSFEDEYEEFTI